MNSSTLFEILSSEAKLRVLKTLSTYNSGLSLRQIEALSGLAIRSVQVATQALATEQVVIIEKKDKKKDKKSFYKFNKKHHLAPVLIEIFKTIEQHSILLRSGSYQEKARFSLKFISQQIELFKKAS